MAREEAHREDLLREATALEDRVELRLPGFAESVVIGFRRDGCGSVYFGQDAAYHFNTSNQLRRVYLEPYLYKAEAGRLARLERKHAENQVQLVRHDLTDEETQALLDAMRRRLTRLQEALTTDKHETLGQVTDDPQLINRIIRWCEGLTERATPIANSPHAR